MIIPINCRVLIKALKEESAFMTKDRQYEEKGIVENISDSLAEDLGIKIGDFIYFEHWGCVNVGDDLWLVPCQKIIGKNG